MRVLFSHRAILASTAALAIATGCGIAPAPRLNVILLMADDLGWGDVGWNGHPTLRTPELDDLAANGVRFDRFYSAPTCSQTRASVLTGRNSRRFGIDDANVGVLRHSEVTLAELLRDAGYTTGIFGKWHLGAMTADEQDAHRGGNPAFYSPPWEHGFDVSFATEARVPTFDPLVDNADDRIGASAYWAGPGRRVPDGPEVRGDDSRIVMDQMLRFIRRSTTEGRPFLAVAWFHAPHVPVRADPDDDTYAGVPLKPRAYYTVVTALDRQIGRLRDELRAQGLARNTLVVFSSDNGPRQGPGRTAGLKGGKDSLFEGGIRVPAALEWPTAIPPRVITTPASTDDLLPTILDLAGVPLPTDLALDGESLRAIVFGERSARSRPIGIEIGEQRAWIDGPLKLIRHRHGDPFELYDVEADPRERKNLTRARPTRVAEMRAELDAWRRSVDRDRRTLGTR